MRVTGAMKLVDRIHGVRVYGRVRRIVATGTAAEPFCATSVGKLLLGLSPICASNASGAKLWLPKIGLKRPLDPLLHTLALSVANGVVGTLGNQELRREEVIRTNRKLEWG